MFFKAQISNCPVHGLRPKDRIELNRTFARFKEFKAHVRLSSVAHYMKESTLVINLLAAFSVTTNAQDQVL